MVVGDQERQRVKHAAEEGAAAGDAAAQDRRAATGLVAGVGEPLREGHADAGAEGGGQTGVERGERAVGGEDHGEDRGQRRERSVHQAAEGGLRTLKQKRTAAQTLARRQRQRFHRCPP